MRRDGDDFSPRVLDHAAGNAQAPSPQNRQCHRARNGRRRLGRRSLCLTAAKANPICVWPIGTLFPWVPT